MVSLALVTIAAGSGLAIRTFGGLPGPADLRLVGRAPQATLLFDAGDLPLSAVFRERRIDVPLSGVSPHLIHAIVAIEDRRFFQHGGLDLRRILAAAWHDLLQGRAAQGASTITQQLARLRFLTREKTLRRKLREMVVARRLERLYTKQEILESYLNQIYFGDGLYGAEAAARGYFGSPAAELDLAQAALLAGLVKAPSSLAPTADLHRAVERRNVVLRAMFEQALIDEPAWAAARQAPVVLRDGLGRDEPAGGYFVELVRRELMDRFGAEEVYERGLRVYTTLDLTMQRAAERAVTGTLRAIEARQAAAGEPTRDESGGPLQASLVAVDPANGEIRALVGGRDFAASRFNRAVHALRQPGSAFKPIVYAAAIEAGYSPTSVLDQLDRPVATLRGAWLPEDGRASTEAISIRSALRASSNRAAVRMLDIVGIPSVVSQAARLGLGRMPPVPALALGSGEVTLLSMTMAYAAFADQGRLHEPTFIRRVVGRDGRVLLESRPSPVPALADTTAFLLADMLADVVDEGTGSGVRRMGFTLPAAGKTGTTNDHRDAWFLGFTPALATGVWVGFDRPRTIVRNGYAGDLAVPLWTRFMQAATSGDGPRWLQPPPGLELVPVCVVSGLLPSPGCLHAPADNGDGVSRPGVRAEYFLEGTRPRQFCGLHPGGTFFSALARAVGFARAPEPVYGQAPEPRVEPAQLASTSAPTPPDASGAPARKRGFWARLFGRK